VSVANPPSRLDLIRAAERGASLAARDVIQAVREFCRHRPGVTCDFCDVLKRLDLACELLREAERLPS
jgi:hypothetical protein